MKFLHLRKLKASSIVNDIILGYSPNNYNVFLKVMQHAWEKGRLKFMDKETMLVDKDVFPKTIEAINLTNVDIKLHDGMNLNATATDLTQIDLPTMKLLLEENDTILQEKKFRSDIVGPNP